MKHLQKLTVVFSILVILFGFYQLNYEQDIFAQSKAYCCNRGLCTYPNSLCTSTSTVDLKPKCHSYTITCRECVNYSATGQVCGDPKNSCEEQSGDCYGWCYYNGTWIWVLSK